MNHIIAPSILAADFANLGAAITLIDESEAQWVHIDVMDGRFVPNISFGPPIIKAIRPYTDKFFDVHIMIVEPEKYFNDFKKAGADGISFHYEATVHVHSAIQQLKNMGIKAGVAINPHTPVSALEAVIGDIDMVLLMSVNPGFGGQSFIPQTIDRIKELKSLIQSAGSNTIIQIDGGVGLKNAEEILAAGADALVAGSSVFKSEDPKATISQLKSLTVNTIKA